MMGSSAAAREEPFLGVDLRMLAARTATGALARAAGGEVGEKAARFEECIRSLEAEKAKMEVFRRELPISVHLIADVIEWFKDELEQQQRLRRRAEAEAVPAPELCAPPLPSPKRKAAAAEGVKAEADANDKRSWMSSAQLWTCGSHTSTSTSNGGSVKKQQHQQKVSNAFMPLADSPAFAKSSEEAGVAAPAGAGGATPLPPAVPDLSLSSRGATDAPCPAAPSATSSAVTDAAGAAAAAQRQQPLQRKARRCWSPELHRRFVAALQRLGGPQTATPKQIRELMKVDGLTNDEVKSHLQKYRLHTRRASDGASGCDNQMAGGHGHGLWPPPPPSEQYTASQHSTSQSGSPQGPLQLTVSVTAGDSCDGGDEDDGRSESYSWEIQNGARASSSS
ncbi:transcription factor HHO6-like [Oryza brachyantha]|uniref:transcription factor HHO6-like n=1 Tax=Oryza brachyantha TaxID=4533 RepID=UPI001ADAA6F5|nr:transcription factor HHO6-like [Oryza brachyantha]